MDPNFVITGTADIQVCVGARTSAGTVMTTNPDKIIFQVPIFITFLIIKCYIYLSWPGNIFVSPEAYKRNIDTCDAYLCH